MNPSALQKSSPTRALPVPINLCHTGIMQPTAQELQNWEAVLKYLKLGMGRGLISRMSYGHQYWGKYGNIKFDWTKPDTNEIQQWKNIQAGRWIATLRRHGLSVKAIARIQDTCPANIRRTLRRYEANTK